MAKVSIIVPIYNQEKYIAQCLDSIICQTLKDIEIICVDDGSTDKSLEIVNEYAAKDSRIIVITKPNAGYGHSMNKGIDAATGEYMGIVESDDYILPEMYEKLYALAVKNNLDFARGGYYKFWTIDGEEKSLYYDGMGAKYRSVVYCPRKAPDLYMSAVVTPAGIYKLDFLRNNGIRYSETPSAAFQDHGFWFKTHILADRALFIDEAFYMYRFDNPNSSIYKKDSLAIMRDEYNKIKTFVDEHHEITCIKAFYWKAMYFAYKVAYCRGIRKINKRTITALAAPFIEARKNKVLDVTLFDKNQLNEFILLLNHPAKYARQLKRSAAHNEYMEHVKFCSDWQNLDNKYQFKWYCKNFGFPFSISISVRKTLKNFKDKVKVYGKKIIYLFDKIHTRINPHYAKSKSLNSQIDVFIKNQKEAEYRNKQLFWWSISLPGETLTQTKERFFMNMPRAEGHLRERQLEYVAVLEALSDLLNANNVPFWPMGGTMIGMLRHKAFVPWDDDIDISMFSKDRDRLYELVKASDTLKIEEVYWCGANSILRCPRVTFRDITRRGLIDIFFWESAGDQDSGNKIIWAKRNAYSNKMNEEYRAVKWKLNRLYTDQPINNPADKKLLDDIIDRNRRECIAECGGTGSTIFGSIEMWFQAGKWIAVYAEYDLYPMRNAEFEGKHYFIPNQAEKFLNDQYGDWMEIPSKVRPSHGG